MHNYLLLLKVRIKEFADPRKLILVPMYAVVFFGIFELAKYLDASGQTSTLPILGYVMALALTFITTILKINDTFSGKDDSEFLLSMPFSSAVQVFSMFTIMYVKNLAYCILTELPCLLVYMQTQHINIPVWIIGLLFTSLMINGIAVLVGIVIILGLASSPKKNQIVSGISLTLIAAVIALVLLLADRIYLVTTGVAGLDVSIVGEVTHYFRIARFYQMGIVEGEITNILLYVFMSLIWYAVFLFMHTMAYQTVITELRSPAVYGTMDEVKGTPKEPEKALLKKEINQFLRSRSYLINASIGLILGIALPINFIILGTETLGMLKWAVPAIICLCVGLSCTTYCSLSMEGRRHWIMETIPMEVNDVVKSKVLINLYLTVPMSVISGILFAIAFHANVIQIILYLVVPVLYSFLTAILGIKLDIKYGSFKSESEDIVLRQGKPFLLGYVPFVVVPVVVAALIVLI